MVTHSKLIRMRIENLGCIGQDGLEVELDDILCLVGRNNSGKTTVLRAYELAAANLKLTEADACRHSPGGRPAVELWVHIPEGTPNIDEKWKKPLGDYLVVKSRWEWDAAGGTPTRSSFDPELDDWSRDEKAAGLDEVFSSRLPKPLRIGTLEGAEATQESLMSIMLDPLVKRIETTLETAGSPLFKAMEALRLESERVVAEANVDLEAVVQGINSQYQQIFSSLALAPKVGIDFQLKPKEALRRASVFEVSDGANTVAWSQQGTGSQRALFWSMLQVRSGLDAVVRQREQREKTAKEVEKKIAKLEKEAQAARKDETKAQKWAEIQSLKERLEGLASGEAVEAETRADGLRMPGHMLLIDEPEVGMHPNAIRAAKKYLYDLARDSGWQVILATHSPAFVDPLMDHTTIVRLDRLGTGLTPKTFRSAAATFSSDERDELQVLLRFDPSLAEMFFGGYPILVEGDTEVGAFTKVMSLDDASLSRDMRPLLVRARGKATLELLIRLLGHFRVPFSVLHDSDSPRTRSGERRHPGWTINEQLYLAIEAVRESGVRVVHRVSIPDFERAHGLVEAVADKPWNMYKRVSDDEPTRLSVKAVLGELTSYTVTEQAFDGDFRVRLQEMVIRWADKNAPGEPAFRFD